MLNLNEINLNKNLLMFTTSMIYIVGISAVFVEHPIIIGTIITLILGVIAKLNIVKLKYLFVWLFIFYLGIYSAIFRISETDILFNLAPIDGTITGKIITIPNNNVETRSKFLFKVDSLEYDNKVLNNINTNVFVNLKTDLIEDFENLKIANNYKIYGNLRKPFKPTNPSQFDYGKYLRNFGAHTILYADMKNVTEIKSNLNFYDKFTQELNKLRQDILTIHSKSLKSPNLELLGGIVFGDDAVAPPDYIKESFIHSGLLHILAASGMNVAFIYGFWFIIAGFFRLPYKARILGGIPLILLYACMTGLGASVVRATIMLIFVLLGKLIDRDTHSIALLSLVAFLMLLYNPSYLNNVGFQLSFIVTFGILVTSPLLVKFGEENTKLSLKHKFLNTLSGIIFIPMIAQLWVMPIQMFYFNTVSLYSIFANILTVPFLSVVSFGGFISSILAPIKFIGEYICICFHIILNPFLTVIVKISEFFASLPNSLLITTHPSLLQIILYYLIILFIIYICQRKLFSKKTIAILATLILILLTSMIKIPNKNFEIIFFDVQNADCILLKTPMNKYFMIDTGKSGYDNGKSQAEFIVTKYLKDIGVRKLDFLIITHFDNDHAGGTVDMMKYGNPDKIYLNTQTSDTYTGVQIADYLKQHPEIQTIYVKNEEIVLEEPQFKVINYTANFENNDNENSIITLISYANQNFLFTGDAGIPALEKLSNTLPTNLTLLKVPHHGAPKVLTKDIVNHLSPKYSIISTGKNMFGHPSPLTINLLKNSKIYRTDKHNSIKVIATPNNTNVYKWNIKLKKYIKST